MLEKQRTSVGKKELQFMLSFSVKRLRIEKRAFFSHKNMREQRHKL